MKAAGYVRKKRGKKRLPRSVLMALRIVAVIVLSVAAVFFTLDYLRINRHKEPPLFCVPVFEYADGSVDYYGLFYKVWMDYDPFYDETEYFATLWFLPKFWSI
jgi:hypothetical protein